MPTSLPVKADVLAMVPASAGITTVSDALFAAQLEAAQLWIGTYVGVSPLIAEASVSNRWFDGFMPGSDGYILDLENAISEDGVTISVNWEYEDGLVPGAWDTIEQTEFHLKPYSGAPYRRIVLEVAPTPGARTIAIAAKWGLCPANDIPGDLWLAIAYKTASLIVESSSKNEPGAKRQKAGPVEKEFQFAGQRGMAGALEEQAKGLLISYL